MIPIFDTIEFGKDMMIDAHSTKVQIQLLATQIVKTSLFIFHCQIFIGNFNFSRYVLLFDYVSDAKKLLYFQLFGKCTEEIRQKNFVQKSDICLEDELTFQIGKKKCKLTQLIGVKRMNLFKCFLDSYAHLINWSILVK